MNWRRGLFRLWVLLAALWFAGTVSMVGLDAYRWWPNKLIKLNVGGQEVQVDETFLRLTHDEQNEEVDKIAKLLKRPPNSFDQFHQPEPPKWEELLRLPPPGFAIEHPFNRQVWAATFVPPLALLALGLCIAWILRGFRQQKSASNG